jgi:phosphoglycerol transferase MdoB-like AlkP superfamily enzyme
MNKTLNNKFDSFYNSLINLFKIYLVGVLMFMAFRVILVISFGDFAELASIKVDRLKAVWFGFRFDTMILCYAMMPAVFIMLAGFLIPTKFSYSRFSGNFFKWYFTVAYFVLFILQVIDYFFFKFFQSHFNLLVFGIIDDDTKAVMESVWTDYPIIWISLMIIAFLFLLFWTLKRITKKEHSFSPGHFWAKALGLILFLGIYFLGARSSLGTFPLEKDDATITSNNFINSIVMNGVFALTDAISEHNRFAIDTNMGRTRDTYNFPSNASAIESYLGRKLGATTNPIDSLFASTPKDNFLKENPPNVIFILMESMSNYYLDFHSESFNLLGNLEKSLAHCLLYRNFLSGHNGTIHTLECILINTPLTPMSQSQYFNESFSTSCALPFYEQGYHTAFITGAKLGWRNLGLFVGNQYFKQVEGNSVILNKVKGAIECEWGVYDEFMFDRMYDCLAESANKDKPVFIFGMSTTNHTPFEHPDTYKPHSLVIPKNVIGMLRTNKDIAAKNFTNYQYANDCLGNFIEKIRNSPLGENTIIAASGDHNTLQLFDYADGQLLQKRSVPLVLYVPEKYLKNKKPDIKVFASQKDIFPTIFNLALSDAKYPNLGYNLFDENISREDFFAVNAYNTAMNDYGAVLLGDTPLFYKWTTSDKKTLVATTLAETPQLRNLLEKTKAYSASATLLIQKDIEKQQKSDKK